ncbi:hypothetical protein FALB51S_00608 [Frigidibacter albus]|uniref:Uncharacterized protein n=1 Tax=Frigidibacter mobilis TaxID=1335048 RepID=A0A159Z7L0_9RHOB|nr:hypothetical protein AKL17_4228 [Frigidibacter mobilis]
MGRQTAAAVRELQQAQIAGGADPDLDAEPDALYRAGLKPVSGEAGSCNGRARPYRVRWTVTKEIWRPWWPAAHRRRRQTLSLRSQRALGDASDRPAAAERFGALNPHETAWEGEGGPRPKPLRRAINPGRPPPHPSRTGSGSDRVGSDQTRPDRAFHQRCRHWQSAGRSGYLHPARTGTPRSGRHPDLAFLRRSGALREERGMAAALAASMSCPPPRTDRSHGSRFAHHLAGPGAPGSPCNPLQAGHLRSGRLPALSRACRPGGDHRQVGVHGVQRGASRAQTPGGLPLFLPA